MSLRNSGLVKFWPNSVLWAGPAGLIFFRPDRSPDMTTGTVLQAAVGLVAPEEAEALFEALGQFVENAQDALDSEQLTELDEKLTRAHLVAASGLLDRMNAALAALGG